MQFSKEWIQRDDSGVELTGKNRSKAVPDGENPGFVSNLSFANGGFFEFSMYGMCMAVWSCLVH